MKEINFISCGMMGDFIHSLAAMKNICERDGAKANIYISDKIQVYGGDRWSMSLKTSYWDLYTLVTKQDWVCGFFMLPHEYDNNDYINMNDWRAGITLNAIRDGYYTQSWSEFLSEHYKYEIKKPYKWLSIEGTDIRTHGKVVIHRSCHRHNPNFKWNEIIDSIKEEIVFLTSSPDEYNNFEQKDKVRCVVIQSMEEMAIAINCCKFFIGNQSAPFALASSLDVPRMVELDVEPGPFYMNEIKYSNNISWYLNEEKKHFSENNTIFNYSI